MHGLHGVLSWPPQRKARGARGAWGERGARGARGALGALGAWDELGAVVDSITSSTG